MARTLLGDLLRTALGRRPARGGGPQRGAPGGFVPGGFASGPVDAAPTRRPAQASAAGEPDAGFVEYAPEADGRPDPGEVVWAWVPYEEDPAQGKDRPVLVVGRDGATLLCLQLTSKDHDLDAEDEARWGRHWMDVGTGAWDSRHRPSEVRLDRLLRLQESGVRREGAALDRSTFDAVVEAARGYHAL